jgi:hypothetical protein
MVVFEKTVLFVYCFGGLVCVGHSFAYVAHFVFLRKVWIRTLSAAVSSRRATNLTTHIPDLAKERKLNKKEKKLRVSMKKKQSWKF